MSLRSISGKHPKQFNEADVAVWLHSIGLGHQVHNFERELISGPMLLVLSEEELQQDLGLSRLQARSFLMKLREASGEDATLDDNASGTKYGTTTKRQTVSWTPPIPGFDPSEFMIEEEEDGSNKTGSELDSEEDSDDDLKTASIIPLVTSKRRKVSLDTNNGKSDTESEDEESEEGDDDDEDIKDEDEDDGWKTKVLDALPTTLKDILSLMDELLTKKGKSPVESFSQVLFFSSKNGKRLRVKLRKMKADGEPKLQWQEKGKEWCPKSRNDLIDFVEVLRQIAIERSYPPVIVKKKKAEPTTKKQAKKKKKKDPNAPKKGMTAYLLFCGAIRPIVKEENPEATFGEISKIVGRKYKELDDNERKPYDEAAAKEKVRFKLESESYHADLAMKSEEDDWFILSE